MARFVKGDVVVVPFPFSDLSQAKRRPALVLTSLPGDDLILCQITSKLNKDIYAIEISNPDFTSGSLNKLSNVRPNRIFTADEHIILYKIGSLTANKMNEIVSKTIEIISK
jgi:mRNA interferase MazF